MLFRLLKEMTDQMVKTTTPDCVISLAAYHSETTRTLTSKLRNRTGRKPRSCNAPSSKPGTAYKVADTIIYREIHSELYSTSGDFDLLMKLYIPTGEDIGKYVNDHVQDIDGIERTLTTLTFKAF